MSLECHTGPEEMPAANILLNWSTVASLNPSVLSATKRMLTNVGCTVYDANHPRNARQLYAAHSHEIDLLLTDVLMPEMNGPELARQLRKLRPRLPILYMSGCIEADILDGVDSVLLHKPFSPDELVAAIRRAIAIPPTAAVRKSQSGAA